ncbi:4-hydroxybenzoate 3-monooxygenase [Streptomyces zinciresistens K42]|uniref:4-hydroxybenzoate 3-monooxygenase n=1 Tax=Streptomyces zinciresistens K42 TaxID=700597 RepID=G2GHM2_9ACTN|nr:4-hydroxybenzoate 3-monooxygenase [Streptomyces zinciresistens K42]
MTSPSPTPTPFPRTASRSSAWARDLPGPPSHDLDTDRPSVSYVCPRTGRREVVRCDFVAGCDGARGVTRTAIPEDRVRTAPSDHGVGRLALLAEAPASADRVLFRMHPDGFAGHMPRGADGPAPTWSARRATIRGAGRTAGPGANRADGGLTAARGATASGGRTRSGDAEPFQDHRARQFGERLAGHQQFAAPAPTADQDVGQVHDGGVDQHGPAVRQPDRRDAAVLHAGLAGGRLHRREGRLAGSQVAADRAVHVEPGGGQHHAGRQGRPGAPPARDDHAVRGLVQQVLSVVLDEDGGVGPPRIGLDVDDPVGGDAALPPAHRVGDRAGQLVEAVRGGCGVREAADRCVHARTLTAPDSRRAGRLTAREAPRRSGSSPWARRPGFRTCAGRWRRR